MGKDEKKQLMQVIDSGFYTESKKCRQFEKEFADFVGCKYATAVTSGTTALYIGLKALGIKSGDEVIVPDFTFVASINAIEMTGAKPVIIDIDPNTLNLNLKHLSHLVNKKTKAIMPVDLNGRSVNFKELSEFSKKHNIRIIEDTAHAIGSYYNGKHSGNMSDVAAFSFSIPKIITTGQGGMLITNNKKIYEKCLAIKDFGRKFGSKKKISTSFKHDTIGYNFKFTEFQAAVGLAQMKKLKQRILKKKKLYKFYEECLHGINQIEFIDTDLKNTTIWSADILLKSQKQKEKLMAYLSKRNIETRIFFPSIHGLSPYKKSDSKFPVSTDISKRGLWLPSSPNLSQNELDSVVKNITNFFKSQ